MAVNSLIWAGGRLGKTGKEPKVIFAQVREYAAIELEVLKSCPPHETAFCIGSGGCTAFSLLAAQPQQLHIVDINPAQVYFIELKKAAFEHLSRPDLLFCLLRDASRFYPRLCRHLSEASRNFWDGQQHLLAEGLNNCGVIEHRLRQIMFVLPLLQNRRSVRRLFAAKTLEQQRQIYRMTWNHRRMDWAMKILFSRPVLKLAYGKGSVEAVPCDFSQTVKERLDDTIERFPLQENGYLWQVFRGKYPKQEAGWPLYLKSQNYQTVKAGLSHTTLTCADAAAWLEAQDADSTGFFALSNILEVTEPAYGKRLLKAIVRAAKPDAKICLRAIFPLDDSIFATCPELLPEPSAELQSQDRSFFCTDLRVLRVQKG